MGGLLVFFIGLLSILVSLVSWFATKSGPNQTYVLPAVVSTGLRPLQYNQKFCSINDSLLLHYVRILFYFRIPNRYPQVGCRLSRTTTSNY